MSEDNQRPSKRRPRMRDVADRAGVGVTTVSRSFTEPDKVSPITLSRIQSAIQDLGYKVNVSARNLRTSTTGRVLIMLPDVGNTFFSLVLRGIEEVALSAKRVVLIGDTRRDRVITQTYSTQSYVSQFGAGGVDGLIILDGSFPLGSSFDEQVDAYPIVAVSERMLSPGIPYVGIDNLAAARDVVGLLSQLGHRRIVHIGGRSGNISAQEREIGYRQAMTDLGFPANLIAVENGDFSIVSGRAAARRILNRYPRPTAVFAANDEMAMGALHEFKLAGLRVPQDISVVGFDDLDFAEVYDPPLSSIRQPRLLMGRRGMELLLDAVIGGNIYQADAVLPHELIIRASIGPAPNLKNVE